MIPSDALIVLLDFFPATGHMNGTDAFLRGEDLPPEPLLSTTPVLRVKDYLP